MKRMSAWDNHFMAIDSINYVWNREIVKFLGADYFSTALLMGQKWNTIAYIFVFISLCESFWHLGKKAYEAIYLGNAPWLEKISTHIKNTIQMY